MSQQKSKELTDYDIARQRFEGYKRKQNRFYFWLILFASLEFLVFTQGGELQTALFTAATLGAYALIKGIELFVASPKRAPIESLTQQEMNWLYGNDWQTISNIQRIIFAQDRIRQRLAASWTFPVHFLSFLVVNAIILTEGRGSQFCLAFPLIWSFFLLRHGLFAYAPANAVARREQATGMAIDAELQAINIYKPKRDAKPKRGAQLVLTDDGEIAEIPDYPDQKSIQDAD
jgi:hypothetical protein